MLVQLLPRLRQLQAVSIPRKEGKSAFRLHLGDLLTKVRLGDVEIFRRLRNTAGTGYFDKIADLLYRHVQHLLFFYSIPNFPVCKWF